MRQKCIKKRSPEPDPFFIQMIRSCPFTPYFHDKKDIENKEEYENDYEEEYEKDYEEEYEKDYEYEEYEDELTKANKRAGYYFDDDGEFQYADEFEEEKW